jgi:hypothetical protein
MQLTQVYPKQTLKLQPNTIALGIATKTPDWPALGPNGVVVQSPAPPIKAAQRPTKNYNKKNMLSKS